MSKQIKQLEMDALRHMFREVRDLVVLSSSRLDCTSDNQVRATLRKKNIQLQMVKNSLARRVFDEMGMKLSRCWEGPTTLAWGAGSLAELSKELEALVKKHEKALKVKGAVSEGQEIEFKQALAMPTRAEAIGRVVALALSPASRLVGQILGPASQVAGQIKSMGEKKEEAAPEAAPTAS
jgi:large subunit ribosomal protein L10